MTYDTVIFDLDGTLLYTLEDLTLSTNYALEPFTDVRRSLDEVRSFVGNGVRTLMIRALPGGEQNPDFEAAFARFRAHYAVHCRDHTRPYPQIMDMLRELKARILLIPLGVVAGTFCGSALAWLVLSGFSQLSLPEALSVGAGFGYYSLATVIITRLGDPALGSMALLSNMIHEALALLLPPFLVRFSGKLGPVLAGGAAAMDTCLPVIAQVSGERCAILAVFSGMCLTLLVPLLIPLLMALR